MRIRLGVSFFICFLLQACAGASTTKTNGVSDTSGNDQAGCIALDTTGIDGAVEKFVWNEEDGIGFLIQDNSYLDDYHFIKSSFTSWPVFATQAADGRIAYSTEDLMKEMWPKERIEDPVSVVAWRPYEFAIQEEGIFFLPVGAAQYDEKGCRGVPMLGWYRGNLAEMKLDFENMFSAVELRLRKDSSVLEPIKVKQIILQGNDGEILAGSIKVVASRQELPDSVCEERKVSPCVVLDCGSGVELKLKEESTSFYLPVLPVEFRRGYSLTVVTDRDSGNMFRIQCGGKFPVRLKKGRIYRAADTIVRPAYLRYMIPDPNFRAYLLEQGYIEEIGGNGSRVVVTPAGRAATKIDCSRRGIASLAGIEYFPLLEELNCRMNMLSTLDLTQNSRLVKLDCSGNSLKSLDVSHNSVLMELRCMLNELVALETDRNPKLTVLHCAFNRSLKALDVTGNPRLKELVCLENNLSSLDVSHNLELKKLMCGNGFVKKNRLETLDVSKNTKLDTLDCSGCRLKALDVSRNRDLISLNCSRNELERLNLGNVPNLKELDCSMNKLSRLDVSRCKALTWISCDRNSLSSLDVSHSRSLNWLSCGENLLTTLELSHNSLLERLMCNDNRLTSLDLSGNPILKELYCCNNRLSSLDLSKNKFLEPRNVSDHGNCFPEEEGLTVDYSSCF